MRDLLRTQHDSGRNAPRNFWNWVRRQPWRRMLPEPIECPGHHLGGIFVYPVTCTDQSCIQKIWLICPILRVRTPLEDKTLEERYHMGSWHMFLPSEVCFGYCILWHCTWIHLSLKISGSHIDVRFASIYHYDQRLFRERFLGPPGVSWLCYMCNVQTAVNASYWPMIFLS